MKVNDVYQSESQFLKAEDLPVGARVGVVIAGAAMHEFTNNDGAKENKIALSFEGRTKKLALNKTNARMITANLGSDDTDDWVGKRIELYRSTTKTLTGNEVPCIRVKEQVPEVALDDTPF